MQQFGITIEEADLPVWDRVAFWLYHSHTIAHVDELSHDERVAFDAVLRAQYTLAFVAAWYELSKDRGVLGENAVNYIDKVIQIDPQTDPYANR